MINPGSKDNKILGCSIYDDREKLKEHSIGNKAGCVPERINDDINFDYLLLNLAATPDMSLADLKLCLFLFHYVVNDESRTKIDNIYSLTDKDIKIRTIGENYTVYVLNSDTEEVEEYKIPFVSLHNRLRKANVHIPITSLRQTLQNLHELGYVTLTEISSAKAEIESNEKLQTDCILIKVNFLMMLALQNKRWLNGKKIL